MHGKVLIADNMIKRNWECNYNYSFCLCINERSEHLLTTCNYTEATWSLVALKFGLPSYSNLPASGGPSASGLAASYPRDQAKTKKKERLGVPLVFWWRIWKERNCKIFYNKCSSPQQVASIIIDEVKLQIAIYSRRTSLNPDSVCSSLSPLSVLWPGLPGWDCGDWFSLFFCSFWLWWWSSLVCWSGVFVAASIPLERWSVFWMWSWLGRPYFGYLSCLLATVFVVVGLLWVGVALWLLGSQRS
jgi:hypothetical protein